MPLTHPQLGTWPTTQARALTGNRTGHLLVCRPELNPLSHTSQGLLVFRSKARITVKASLQRRDPPSVSEQLDQPPAPCPPGSRIYPCPLGLRPQVKLTAWQLPPTCAAEAGITLFMLPAPSSMAVGCPCQAPLPFTHKPQKHLGHFRLQGLTSGSEWTS